jgi:hypothetical protein
MKVWNQIYISKSIKPNDEYDKEYICSADVVGLMCLKVFVNGDDAKYKTLEHLCNAIRFSIKSKFLRDLPISKI